MKSYSRSGAPFCALILVIFVVACGRAPAAERVIWVQDPFDPTERRIPALHDLVLGPSSRLEGLAQDEMSYDGPVLDDQG